MIWFQAIDYHPQSHPAWAVVQVDEHDSSRPYNCAACNRQIRLCRRCDHGNRYGPDRDCTMDARRALLR